MLFEGYSVDCTLKKTKRKTEQGRLALQHSSLSTSGGKYLLNIIHLWPPCVSSCFILRLCCIHRTWTSTAVKSLTLVQSVEITARTLGGPAEFKDSDCPCLLLTILSGWHTIRHSGTSWAQPSCHLVDTLISSALEEPTVLKYIICAD